MTTRSIMIAGLGILTLGGCIQVKAPDKPIEINLNVKVQQEVVVRLQRDAQDLIQNNPELFPQ
ncbi:YnbE family lipoprotein [Sphingobium sp.]|uniref:YnbE family lipoprotein n=1 Tax=Sphingobium sp. TaxID=1912891 RepID=UPI003BB75F0D